MGSYVESLTSRVKDSVEQGDCTGATCQTVCECAYSSCASQASACLADSTCADKQTCAFNCACGDSACGLACAAGDDLATALIGCVATSCSGSAEDIVEQGDCS